jgi:hypothetical protein
VVDGVTSVSSDMAMNHTAWFFFSFSASGKGFETWDLGRMISQVRSRMMIVGEETWAVRCLSWKTGVAKEEGKVGWNRRL